MEENSMKKKTSIKNKPIVDLPPCLVCGDIATGVHFGAITCEACKVFFRRSFEKESSYSCFKSGSCNIFVKNRSFCSYCRLRKCYAVGMSKSAAKRGRRSVQQKQDIKEVECEVILRAAAERNRKNIHQEMVNEAIKRLNSLHKEFRLVTPEHIERLQWSKTQQKIMEEGLDQCGESHAPLPPEEIRMFYQETGIDLSGIIPHLACCAQSCTDKYALSFISYLKSLKEFMDLSLPDRVTTLKGSALVWLLVSAPEMFNYEDFSFNCLHCGRCYAKEHMHFMEYVGLTESFFQAAKKYKVQNFTEEEVAILRGFVIFDPSLTDLELAEPEKISAVQELFLDCLLHTLADTRGEEKAAKIFTKIIEFLTDVRECLYERDGKMNHEMSSIISQEVKYSRIAGAVFNMPENYINDLDGDLSAMHL